MNVSPCVKVKKELKEKKSFAVRKLCEKCGCRKCKKFVVAVDKFHDRMKRDFDEERARQRENFTPEGR